ncbi:MULTISPECIES: FecR family protein [unclassified Butyricimonas]|uniref:FecR family protein n=1 Tax=unclassified Butyricimonas TaxID=2637652 RepID=UPI000C06EC17|nr:MULTISPECIES: FecR domain-containing protein [unclassified Butyricimonas]
MLNRDEIDSFLLRYLLNELNADECKQVEKWLGLEEYKEYFREFCCSYIHMQWAVRDDAVSEDYKNFRKRYTRRRRLKTLIGIAAGITLLIGVGLQQFVQNNHTFVPGIANNMVVHPGASRAILHLSTGEMVPIDTSFQKLEEKDGTCIEVHDNGSLNYFNDSVVPGDIELLNRLEVPRKGEFQLVLADGTRVWVNSASELSYPSNFTGKERVVYLKGEAFFDVTRDDARPFVVKVGDLDVKVYGTQFNVNTHRTGIIQTVLVKGCIGLNNGEKEMILEPEEKGEYNSADHAIQVEKVDVLPYIVWKEGMFIFRNESLESIMDKLTLWYDLEVIYEDEEVKEERLSGIMERYKNVNELFHFFEKTSEIKFTVYENTVYIKKQK